MLIDIMNDHGFEHLYNWYTSLLEKKNTLNLFIEIRKIAVCFLWLSLPGDCSVTDEALLAETT